MKGEFCLLLFLNMSLTLELDCCRSHMRWSIFLGFSANGVSGVCTANIHGIALETCCKALYLRSCNFLFAFIDSTSNREVPPRASVVRSFHFGFVIPSNGL